MLSVKLVVVGGDAKNKEVQLKLPTIIGRGREGVSLTLPHKLVSRKHTELFEHDGKLFVKDLGSLNGTFVNSKRIVQRTPLNPNELLTLGNVTFRAVYDDNGVAAAPEIPEFQEVSSSEEVLDEPVSKDSDTNKSMLDISPADISDDVPEDVDAALAEAAASASSVKAESSIKSQPAEEEPELEKPADKAAPAEKLEPAANLKSVAESKSSGSSDIFSGPAIEGATPEKSISMSAIHGLPTADKNADFEVQLDGLKKPESIKQVEIDLDEPAAAASPEDSRLGSFLKKMPR